MNCNETNLNPLEGNIDIIGLDVLRVNTYEGAISPVLNIEDAKNYLYNCTRESFDYIVLSGTTYIIRTIVADLNKITSLLPEDLDPADRLALQMRISEILSGAGIAVVPPEIAATIATDVSAPIETISPAFDDVNSNEPLGFNAELAVAESSDLA